MAKISKEEEVALFEQVVKDLPIDLEVAMRFFKIQKERDGSPKMMGGKPKIDGKQLALKLKETDAYSPTLLAWIEAQNNFTDSIKYLMEKEIITNGVRDLSQHIPRVRDLEKSILEYNNNQYKEQVSSYREYSIPRDTDVQRHQPIPRDIQRELGNYQQHGHINDGYTEPQVEAPTTYEQTEQRQEKVEPKNVAVEIPEMKTPENVQQPEIQDKSTQNLKSDSIVQSKQSTPKPTVQETEPEADNIQDEVKVSTEKEEVPPVKKKETKDAYPGW